MRRDGYGWWACGGLMLAVGFGLMANHVVRDRSSQTVYVEADGSPVSIPPPPSDETTPPIRYVRISEGAAKVIRVLDDDSRRFSGGKDWLHVTEGEQGKDFRFVMSAGRNDKFWGPIHGTDLYVTVPAKGWPNDCPVHRDFTEADVGAVMDALDRRLKKLDAKNETDQKAERRKALEGLR